MNKYIIPSSIVSLIVVGVLLNVYSNTSDEQSVQATIQTEVKTEIKTNMGELTTHDILSQLDEEVVVVEIEVDEDNEPEVVPEPEPKVEPVIVKKPKPVIVSVPKPEPKVNITEPDFQTHEYYQRIPEIAPIIHDYKPKPEWFIPDGNPEEFSMDNIHDFANAYGVNIKRIYLTINKQYIETPLSTLEGMTSLLKQYISQDFYFVGDNEEESQLRSIHVNVKSLDEANQLIKEMKQNVKILDAYNGSTLLPQFKDRETEIEAKSAKFSEL